MTVHIKEKDECKWRLKNHVVGRGWPETLRRTMPNVAVNVDMCRHFGSGRNVL